MNVTRRRRPLAPRTLLTALVGRLLLASCLPLAAHEHTRPPNRPRAAPASRRVAPPAGPTCRLTIELVDAAGGQPLPGIIRLRDAAGQGIEIAELINRGQGIDAQGPIHQWWVLPAAREISVPAARLEIEALSGLETELTRRSLDLTGQSRAALRVPLVRFFEARRRGAVAGNTHLHLMKLSKDQADRYLREVPLADGLEIVFLSYLERAMADLEYTSNNYRPGDLQKLSGDRLKYGWGQEQRHNFGSHGEGFGHLLLLDIPYVVQPVSIGPGITRQGADFPPLANNIDAARRLGGKVIWAHNNFGFEDIPNWVLARVDANNIFDGSAHGSFKDSYYRYLNVGLRVPFSTGTDWFIYDFSRVYVASDRPLTPSGWLDRLREGRSFISNGPLLEFTANGRPSGETVALAAAGAVTVRGHAVGRLDFKRLELVRNGQVIATAASRAEGGHFTAALEAQPFLDGPAWLALRTLPPPVKDDPQLQEPVADNEFGGALFAHTSPVYVSFAGRRTFDATVARGLIDEMRRDQQAIAIQATFTDATQRQQVDRIYTQAIDKLEEQIQEHAH